MVILEIYLDVIFLENFLMDYILLMLTGKILQRHRKKIGMAIAASFGSGYTLLYYILLDKGMLTSVLQIMNLFVLCAMARIAYEKCGVKQTLIDVFTMTALSFVTGGILTWIGEMFPYAMRYRIHITMFVGAALFGYMFLKRWTEGIRDKLFYKKTNVPVYLKIGNQEIYCRGLLDSGNSLYEPISGRPVVVVEKGLLTDHSVVIPEHFFAIPYHAVGTQKGILKGVLADELEIPEQQGEKRWQKVMLGIYEGKISQKDEYQVILHPKL